MSTAQIIKEDTISEADSHLEILLETSPQLCLLFNDNFKLVDCSASAVTFMGFESKEDMLAGFSEKLLKSIPEFQPDGRKSIPLLERFMTTLKEGYVKFETELYINGEKRVAGVEFRKISYADSFEIMGFVYDFTDFKNQLLEAENKRAQAEMLQMQADAANRAKTEFLSHISHEMRTPMNAILGTAEVQLQKESVSPDVDEAFNMIHNSGNLLLNIINDMLDLSKIEAGRLEILPVKYDIPSIIYDTVQLNLLRYEGKPVEFNLLIDENTPLDMIGDELRIKQVLGNVLSNAFKYTEKGKVEVAIHAEGVSQGDGAGASQGGGSRDGGGYIPDSDVRSDCTLVMRVRDTGQGMTDEQKDRLFDAYTRFNIDANRTIVGTGLGMHITKRLIDAMGGEISVESEFCRGSEFTIRIPQVRIGTSVCGSDLAKKMRKNRYSGAVNLRAQIVHEYMPYGSVLVVDDVESNLYVAKGMMLPYGLKIETAPSGFVAIEKIRKGNTYDIIFMDHMMPVMNGVDTVKILREMRYKKPIVALTANAVAGAATMFLANGFDDFVSKPIDIRELNSVLNRLVRDKHSPDVVEAARKQMELQKPLYKSMKTTALNSDFIKVILKDIEYALDVLGDILPRVERAGEEDLKLFTTTVHGLKSVLTNLGETELSATALKLERAGDAKDISEITTYAPKFADALKFIYEKHSEDLSGEDDSAFGGAGGTVGTVGAAGAAGAASGGGGSGGGAAGGADAISEEDRVYLKEKLIEIKAACEKIQQREAKAALGDLKVKTWPNKLHNRIDDISIFVLKGEFRLATAVVEELLDI